MTTSTDSYTAAAGQARQATEKSVEVFRNAAQSFTNQFDAVKLPMVDLTQPVTRYFEFLQRAVDFNRDLATQWAELFTTLSGSVREQAEQLSSTVKDQTNTVTDSAVKQAEKAERAAKVQAEEVEEAEKAKAREAKRVEREEARRAQQQAREPYEGLTKAELSDQLADRGLPKTGNIDDLIERLVSADSSE